MSVVGTEAAAILNHEFLMIYLDYNATTPVLPEVLETMMPYFTTEWGNPSSTYKFGYKIKSAIETAREQVANLIGAHPTEVIFTSCATESNNAAIHAALKANPNKRHIVTSALEHSSVLNYCASSGSACLADSDEPSHVIKAMKPECHASQGMVRFSLDVSNIGR